MTNANIQTNNTSIQASQPSESAFGVTELVLTHEGPEQLALLLPMIAYLSRHAGDRWITWIAPRHINRQVLEDFGVSTRCLRLIHCTDASSLWIIWEAMAKGNSHTVIASPGRLNEKELGLLEEAARLGECQGVLLRSRQEYLQARSTRWDVAA